MMPSPSGRYARHWRLTAAVVLLSAVVTSCSDSPLAVEDAGSSPGHASLIGEAQTLNWSEIGIATGGPPPGEECPLFVDVGDVAIAVNNDECIPPEDQWPCPPTAYAGFTWQPHGIAFAGIVYRQGFFGNTYVGNIPDLAGFQLLAHVSGKLTYFQCLQGGGHAAPISVSAIWDRHGNVIGP